MVKASVSPGCFTTSPLAQESFWFVVDYSNVSAIERLFTLVKDRFRRLDLLVNNVAYTKKSSARPALLTRSEDQTRDALANALQPIYSRRDCLSVSQFYR
jgi:NAD(P)-dependent dehydrogenase (short-subunit alcohol dehydrogenase family)